MVKAEEPWVILPIKKHKFSLLIDTGASISPIPFSLETRSSKKLLFGTYQASLYSIISFNL
jgi:hypothetical protein